MSDGQGRDRPSPPSETTVEPEPIVLDAIGSEPIEPKPIEPDATKAQPKEMQHRVSVLLYPLAFINSTVAAGIELAFTPRWSVGVMGGVSWRRPEATDWLGWLAGAEGRYYVYRTFENGLPIILAARYAQYESNFVALTVAAGYKYVFGFGLTLDGNIGPELSYSFDDERFRPSARLSLGLGWSF